METLLLPRLDDQRVLLAVCGGIAAYKAADLCRLLIKCGARVDVMMTAAAQRFVGPVTFAALTNRPVAVDLFDPSREAQIGHIQLADEASLLLVAPATANMLAKMSHGLADDLVSTVCLAYQGPVLLAPAMNVNMWRHSATQQNIGRLRDWGQVVVGPDSGELACGHVGAGRMSDPLEIVQAVGRCLGPGTLAGRRVVVSAGPTHEPLDPVRYLGNRSSGRMGFALAAEAAARGAETVLVAGPVSLPTPAGVQRRDVTTAAQMAQAVEHEAARADVVLMAAAVADYRPREAAADKLKKERLGDAPRLELERNPDILARLGQRTQRPLLVGFAAETGAESLAQSAPQKLRRKGCDLLVANDVTQPDAGFEVETNRVTLYSASAEPRQLPLMSKRQLAGEILDRVAELLGEAGR